MSTVHYEWNRAEPRALARLVQPAALPAELAWPNYINRLDLRLAEGPRGVAAQLYELIRKRALHYDLEPFNPNAGKSQLIRTPATILAEQRGTCLDLSVLFATLCLANELLPLIIVVDGHAFAGLSLMRTRPKVPRAPQYMKWSEGLLTDYTLLQNLAGQEYLFVECTGLAQSKVLSTDFPEGQGRNSGGTLSFERAVEAGQEQVLQHLRAKDSAATVGQRTFLYALDLHELQVNYGFEPVSAADDAPAAGAPAGKGSIIFGNNAQIGGDVITGDKTETTIVNGDYVGRDKITNNNQGSYSTTVGNVSGSGIAIGAGAQSNYTSGVSGDELGRLFAGIYEQIQARPGSDAQDKEELKTKVQLIEQEARKGDQANAPKVERWLKGLLDFAPDVLELTVAALSGPAALTGTVIKNVVQRFKKAGPG